MEAPKRLNEWQDMFSSIYCERNKKRSRESILLRLVEEMSEVSEALREENFTLAQMNLKVDDMIKRHEKVKVLEWELPDMFAWLCAFATCVNHKLEDDVWHKYPRLCPYCIENQNCICIAKAPEEKPQRGIIAGRIQSAINNEKIPSSLNEWQDVLDKLYKKVNRVQEEEVIGFHLQEEIGELSRELRKKMEYVPFDEKDLSDEIADVFSWTIGLASRMSLNMEKITWQKFPGKCPYCDSSKCECRQK
jgi:NTP pyrophosphatase (non-canonical NTP hydrolase)